MDSLDAMSMDEMKAMIISMREENNKLKSEVPPPAVPFSSPSSSSSSASLSEAEILLGKLSLEQINRKIAIQKIISSIHLDANQRGLKLSNPRNAAELMNYKTSIIEYLNGKKLLFTILDKYNGRDLLNDINNIYLLVKDEAKIIVYNFLKSTMADRIRSQYGSDSNKCDPKVLWHRLMTADVEEVNLPGVKKAKTTLLDAVELQFNENSVTAAQHIERIEKAFAEYGHLVQYYRECGKNAVPIDNDDLSEGDKIVVLLNSIMKAAKHEKAYQQLHRDLLKVRTYEAACDEFKNAVASRQALLSQLSNRGNDLLFAEDVESSTNDSIGVVNAIRSRQCINCGKEGHRSGYQPEGKKGEWIHSCPSRIIQCPRCNRWGHQEQFCRTPRVKFVSKDRYPDPNLSRNIRAEKNDAEDDNADEKKNNAGKEEVSGGRLRNKLIGKSALCVDKLLLHYNDRK